MTKTPLDRIDYLIQWYKDEDSSHDYSNLDVAKELEEIRKDVYVIYADNAISEPLLQVHTAAIQAAKLIIANLKSALAAEREKHRWIPVTERLPEFDSEVLIITRGEVVYVAKHSSMIQQWRTIDGVYFNADRYLYVTHWQPLPAPPEEE